MGEYVPLSKHAPLLAKLRQQQRPVHVWKFSMSSKALVGTAIIVLLCALCPIPRYFRLSSSEAVVVNFIEPLDDSFRLVC